MSENFYVYGPRLEYLDTDQSIGMYLYKCLKRRDTDDILYVDAISKDTLTCGQLLEQSIKLVDILKGLSISNGDIVCVISENNLNHFTTLLACFLMGAVPYPLNPAYKEDELRLIFRSVKTKLLICSEAAFRTLHKVNKEFSIPVLLLNRSSTFCEMQSVETLIANTSINKSSFTPIMHDNCDDEALILCSSGTSGIPKEVMLTHKNLIWLASTTRCIMSVLNAKTTIQLVPSFHVYGTVIQISAIVRHMKVIVMSGFNPDLFLKTIEEEQISTIFVIPLIVDFMAKSHLIDKYKISCLKNIVSGSAQLPDNNLSQRLEGANVLQAYGSTELSGPCTFQTPNQCKTNSVGSLLAGTVAKIYCDKTQRVLSPTQVGEICIAGPMLMKGYLDNDAATQACVDEDNFFHTGDIGYFDKDNCLYIVDRVKDIIKNKGFQVSPSELENLILKHTAVKDCGVIGIPDARAGEVPLAYIVPNDGVNVTEDEIIQYVAERISVQKHLYGGVRFVDTLPRTASGKLLRLKLRELYNC